MQLVWPADNHRRLLSRVLPRNFGSFRVKGHKPHSNYFIHIGRGFSIDDRQSKTPRGCRSRGEGKSISVDSALSSSRFLTFRLQEKENEAELLSFRKRRSIERKKERRTSEEGDGKSSKRRGYPSSKSTFFGTSSFLFSTV